MRCILVLIYSISITFTVAGSPKIDSLKNELKSATGESKINILLELCNATARSKFEQSVIYGIEASKLSKRLIIPLLEGKSYRELGDTYLKHSRFATSILYHEKSLKIFKSIDNPKEYANALNNLGSVYRNKGDFDNALLYYLQSLQIKDSLGGYKLTSAYGNIGLTYRQKGEYEKALKYLFRSIALETKANNKLGMAIDYGNIGTAYENMGDFKKAIEYAKNALTIDKELNDNYGIGIDLNNLGEAYFGMKNYSIALKYYRKAVRVKKSSKNSNGVAYTYQRMANLFLETKNYDSAIYYSTKSVFIVKNNGNKERELKNYKVLASIYEAKKEPIKALEYIKMYHHIKDSLYTINKELISSDLESKYQSNQKDSTIKAQLAIISQERKLQISYIILAGLLLSIIFGLYYYYQKRQLQNKILSKLNKELDKRNNQNELLLKEIHHRVKNNLEMVKSLIALQSAKLDDSATKDAMIASQNRVQSIGIIHQKLYQGENLGSVEMKSYFINLSEEILDNFDADNKIKIECAMDNLDLDIDTAVPIGLIVNELLTNTLKYAFPDEAKGKIHISMAKPDSNTLMLTVADNGIGKKEGSTPKGTGFGSQLIELLTQQLNGKMQENTTSGMRVTFQFNLDSAA